MTARRSTIVVALLLLAAAVAYLRDPAWLIDVESGFRPWEQARDGTRFRWTSGHASFFVPAALSSIVIPVRTTMDGGHRPVTVRIAVDDRTVSAVTLTDEMWRQVVVRLPPRPGRRVRRVDLLVDHTGPGNRGVAVGQLEKK